MSQPPLSKDDDDRRRRLGEIVYQCQCQACGQPFEANRRNRQFCSRACRNRANNARAGQRLQGKPVVAAWSCGGGVQSTAIAALIVAGALPKPDLAYMTDCGWEKAATWEYVYQVTIPRLRAVGVELQIIKTIDFGEDTALIDKAGHCVIPAYQYHQGRIIRFRTHCNAQWKLKVARRWLRSQGVRRCENWIGISVDEARRRKESPFQWCVYRYPLLERDMTREECMWTIGAAGWPMPPRTSCIICPQQSDRSWLQMKRHFPGDWALAVAAEAKIQAAQPGVFLHRSMVPLPEVQLQ